MPLFRRQAPEYVPPPEVTWPAGTLPCSEQGCSATTAIMCAYRDRRGHRCAMAFCPDHWATVGGLVYCRRHAGTVTALGPDTEAGALPELNNRGPSLVNWVADDIGMEVAALLRATARGRETVSSEPSVRVVFDRNRHRHWERSWKLIESTGISLKVSVTVKDDDDDALISVQVDSNVVARGVPPWIAQRRANLPIGDDGDAGQREQFRQFIIGHISTAVAELRTPR